MLDRVPAIPTLKALWSEVQADDVSGLAAELAYRFLLALFPFLIFVTALGALLARLADIENPAQRLVDATAGTLPPDAATLVRTQLDRLLETDAGGLLSVGVVSAIWAASGGVRALMKAMNRAYEVDETRPAWRRYALSIALVLGAGTSLLAAFVILLAGQVVGRHLLEGLGLGSATSAWVNIARVPLVGVLVAAAVAVLYWAAPDIGLPFRWLSPGAALFVVSWLAATLLFGFYVSGVASYNATYGALGGVVVLLLWAYLSAFLLLTGAELNATLLRQAARAIEADAPTADRAA